MSTLLSPLMSQAQLLAELNICQMTLNKMQQKYPDMPRAIKIGARNYFDREAMQAWLRNFLPKKSGAA